MAETIRVGILGAGWAGESHANAFLELPNVEVTALWSRTRASAETLARQLNQPTLRVYDHWQELIERSGVDVISMATPPMFRREPVIMAYERDCNAHGSLGEGLSHDFDKARFLTGSEFTHMVSQIAPLTIKSDADFPVDGGSHMHLAKLTGGLFGEFRFTVTAGEGDWTVVLSGDEGTFIIDGDDAVRRQRADDDEPVSMDITAPDRPVAGTNLMQHSWNRLIADFVQAIRQGDVSHKSVPHLPTVEDGLRCQEIIHAARKSDEEMRWVSLAEFSEDV